MADEERDTTAAPLPQPQRNPDRDYEILAQELARIRTDTERRLEGVRADTTAAIAEAISRASPRDIEMLARQMAALTTRLDTELEQLAADTTAAIAEHAAKLERRMLALERLVAEVSATNLPVTDHVQQKEPR